MSPSSQNPAISIVIPSRNTRDLTLACLASLHTSTEDSVDSDSIEILVIDDAGDDDTVAMIEQHFPTVRVLRNEQSRGFTVSANRGLKEANGEFLLLLNSDTEVPARSLAALVEALQNEVALGIAGASLRYPDGSGQWSGGSRPTSRWLLALSSGFASSLARIPGYRRLRPVRGTGETTTGVDWVTGAAMMIRASVWEDLGPLDERFDFYCQDLDYCLRAKRAGWRVRVIPSAPVVHHHGATIAQVDGAGGFSKGSAAERAVTVPPDGMKPRLLWRDLLRWSLKEDGERGFRKTARILGFGTHLRLCARRLRRLVLSPSRRTPWDARSEDFRLALDEIEIARKPRFDESSGG